MTKGLLELGDCLGGAGCTHVAMESTGSFWKPVYNLQVESHPFSRQGDEKLQVWRLRFQSVVYLAQSGVQRQ
jgi:hypothetical protein